MTLISSFRQTAPCGLAFFFLLLLVVSLLSYSPLDAHAGDFSVNPVRVELSARQNVAALKIRNSGDTDLAIQAQLVRWDQTQGKDRFEPTRDLLVTPPLVTIPAGSTQTLRVGLRVPPEPDQELSYRLFLQELPSPEGKDVTGLQMVTRLSLPVFVAPASAEASPGVRWVAQRGPAGRLLLAAYNAGSGHALVTDLVLVLDNGHHVSLGGNHYLLPSTDRVWVVKPGGAAVADTASLKLTAKVNGGGIDVSLQVQ